MRHMHIVLHDESYEKLRELAHRQRCPMSQMIRDALDGHLKYLLAREALRNGTLPKEHTVFDMDAGRREFLDLYKKEPF